MIFALSTWQRIIQRIALSSLWTGGPEVGGGGGGEGIFEAAKTVEYLLDHQSSDSLSP